MVGSNWTNRIRQHMCDLLQGNNRYVLFVADQKKALSKHRYLQLMRDSIFSLAPEGYYNSTFRLWDALRCGSGLSSSNSGIGATSTYT